MISTLLLAYFKCLSSKKYQKKITSYLAEALNPNYIYKCGWCTTIPAGQEIKCQGKEWYSYRFLWLDNFHIPSEVPSWESYVAETPGLATEINLFAVKVFCQSSCKLSGATVHTQLQGKFLALFNWIKQRSGKVLLHSQDWNHHILCQAPLSSCLVLSSLGTQLIYYAFSWTESELFK